MAKDSFVKAGLEDAVCPVPSAKGGAETSFGDPLTGGQGPESGGELGSGVQFAKIAGASGEFEKIPGSGGQNNKY